jgi:hypothetical protein
MTAPLLCWLHLSDIHTGRGGIAERLDQQDVWGALQKDVLDLIAHRKVPNPSALFVTGDIAYSGRMSEYVEIGEKLLALAEALSVPRAMIFTVPGNHDVQRQACLDDPDFRLWFDNLRKGPPAGSIDDALDVHPEWWRKRFEDYLNFATLCAPSSKNRDLYWSFQPAKTERLRFRVVGLNTALLSHNDEDEGRLMLGLKQTVYTLPHNLTDLVILLTHHPIRPWLREHEDVEVRLRSRAHIHLYGHAHVQDTIVVQPGGEDGWLKICAGAVHAEEDQAIRHGYNFGAVEADPDGHLYVTIWPRRWSNRHRGFIVDAENAEQEQLSARHRLRGPLAEHVLGPAVDGRHGPLRHLFPTGGVAVAAGGVLALAFALFWLATTPRCLATAPFPRKDGVIADFGGAPGGPPRSGMGLQFSLLSDSSWNLPSIIRYERVSEDGARGGFLRIHYELISQGARESFVGVYVDFSYPPPCSFDVSSYSKLTALVRVGQPSEGLALSFVLYSEGPAVAYFDYAFPVYEVPQHAIRQQWTSLNMPLREFKEPNFSTTRMRLDDRKVYRLGIVLKGPVDRTIHGHLDVDDLRFE